MRFFEHNFEYDDRVRFVGRDADHLRRNGESTTGIVVMGIGHGDPRVCVELDAVEGTFQGGGATHCLCAWNWWFTGQPIIHDPSGRRERLDRSLRRTYEEMLQRPEHLQNPTLLAGLRKRLCIE